MMLSSHEGREEGERPSLTRYVGAVITKSSSGGPIWNLHIEQGSLCGVESMTFDSMSSCRTFTTASASKGRLTLRLWLRTSRKYPHTRYEAREK